MNKLISIALPFYNAEETLKKSIVSILVQSYNNWELLLIDDGSTDTSLSLAKSFDDQRIRIISDGRNIGISARLNQALDLAKGEYFCRMDADDIAFAGRLQKQLDLLQEHETVDLVATSVVVFKNDGTLSGVIPVQKDHHAITARPWRGFYFPHPTWMGKVEWFKKHPYAIWASGAEDQHLLYSAFAESKFAGIPEVLLAYREDSRTLKKMIGRRIKFWHVILYEALKKKRFCDAICLCFIQPIKILGDFLNIKFNWKCAKNKMREIRQFDIDCWNALQCEIMHFEKHKKINEFNKK